MNRVRERFEDKVDRVQSVAAELYCRCGDREEETAVNNLQLISQLPSFGKRKRRDVGTDSQKNDSRNDPTGFKIFDTPGTGILGWKLGNVYMNVLDIIDK